jgi:23S rRNA pseudouridine1911/1915/1917 synthase
MSIKVLYEDNHLLVLNKPSGLLVHGDQTGDKTLLDWGKYYIKKKYNKPGDVFLGVTHRLDRPASGVVILARTSKALARINNLIKNRQIEKKYFAISEGKPPYSAGSLVHYLIKNRGKNKVQAFDKPGPDRKKAELDYRVIGQLQDLRLFEIELRTGRSHQIRVQLSSLDCPIIGDLKYGYPKAIADKSIALHCAEMSFIHPVKKEVVRIQSSPKNIHPWNIFWEFFR